MRKQKKPRLSGLPDVVKVSIEENEVRLNNLLARAVWDIKLGVYTLRILGYYGTKIKHDGENATKELKPMDIPVPDIAGTNEDVRKFLRTAAPPLLMKEGATFFTFGGDIHAFSLFSKRVDYIQEIDCLRVAPNDALRDYLLEQTGNYTLLDNGTIQKLPNVRAQILYFLLRSYRNLTYMKVPWDLENDVIVPGYFVSLDQLQDNLGEEKAARGNWAEFERRTLKPTKEKVKDTFFFDYKPWKAKGRKWTHVMFIFDTPENIMKEEREKEREKTLAALEADELLKPYSVEENIIESDKQRRAEINIINRKIEADKKE